MTPSEFLFASGVTAVLLVLLSGAYAFMKDDEDDLF